MPVPWDMEKIARLQDLRGMFDFDNPSIICEKLKQVCHGDSDASAFAEDYIELQKAVLAFKDKYHKVYNPRVTGSSPVRGANFSEIGEISWKSQSLGNRKMCRHSVLILLMSKHKKCLTKSAKRSQTGASNLAGKSWKMQS